MKNKARRVSVIWWVLFLGVIAQPAALAVLSLLAGNGYVLTFAALTAFWIGALVLYVWLQDATEDARLPIPARPNPRYIFRLVKRDERATYVRIMRRTYAVHMRDLSREMERAMRAIGRAFLPVVQRTVAAIDAILKR